MKKPIIINNQTIKEGGRVFIIAEAGVNHNGELQKALELVDVAAEIGADAVKFQTFRTNEVVTDTAPMAKYQEKNTGKSVSQKEMIKAFELPEKDWPKIVARCKEKNILFLSTPHGGVQSVDLLEKLDVVAYKIGSGDVTNFILLGRVAKTKKPIIISSGMSGLAEIEASLAFLKKKGAKDIVALHCTTSYPCPVDQANLLAMETMMRELSVPVGFSDHTLDKNVAGIATCMGMALYEFHYTLDQNLPGPDHKASANPEQAKERVAAIRAAEAMTKAERETYIKELGSFYKTVLGSGIKQPTQQEIEIAYVARKSIVAAKKLAKGHTIVLSDLKAKRPGDGLSPAKYEQLIGKKLNRSVKADEQLHLEDVQ